VVSSASWFEPHATVASSCIQLHTRKGWEMALEYASLQLQCGTVGSAISEQARPGLPVAVHCVSFPMVPSVKVEVRLETVLENARIRSKIAEDMPSKDALLLAFRLQTLPRRWPCR